MQTNKYTCMIIGDPVSSSRSPALHNACYKALGIENEYHYIAKKVPAAELGSTIKNIKNSNVRGISCTMPHKQDIMQHLDKIDHTALKIKAVNTVVNENGLLTGYNTDWMGILKPLEKICPDLSGRKVALLGAGGAARAAAYALKSANVDFTIFNRTGDKAKSLALEFEAKYENLGDSPALKDFDIVINTTSIGMNDANSSPIGSSVLNSKQIIFDTVYSPLETLLIKQAKLAGAQIIYGTEMLIYQAAEQFELYTGLKAPIDVMQNVINNPL